MIGLLVATLLAASPAAPCGRPDPCGRGPRAGEAAIVFLGDSGYGPGGASEWGPHSQAAVAARLDRLCPRPDLVFFLGDNVYWTGSADLFGPRFDSVYAGLFDVEQRRVHAALGNHDVKGCRVSTQAAFSDGETCADALGRLVVEDVGRDAPASGGPAPRSPLLVPELLDAARGVRRADCPPAFDRAYEQSEESGMRCFASEALRHRTFGYALRRGEPLRYYSIDHPPAGGTGPRVRVLVTDSNTLRAGAGPKPGEPDERVLLPEGSEHATPARADVLQALWVENQLRTAGDAWTFVTLHHPPYSPRGCAFKVLGRCVGGHSDDEAVRNALGAAFTSGGVDRPRHEEHRPDMVLGAHNHFYARSRPLDAEGHPAEAGEDAVRYVVTGGGGAPLYRMQPLHARYAAGGAFHHFFYARLRGEEAFFWAIDETGRVRDSGCFTRGEPIDRCIASGSYDSDELSCGGPAPVAGCPAAR